MSSLSCRSETQKRKHVAGLHPLDHRLELEVALALGVDAHRGAGELHELVDLGEAWVTSAAIGIAPIFCSAK